VSTVTNRITIARPIEDVFGVLTDVEKTGLWFPGDVEEHWTSPPPHGVGSTRRAVVRMGRRQTENDAVVTEFDPPHRAAMKGIGPEAPFEATLSFVTTGDGTDVTVTTGFLFHGPVRVVAPLFTAWYGRSWRRGLQKLKLMMESGEL
jgi:uncharacterized protein YndB with AHSA1/START domain